MSRTAPEAIEQGSETVHGGTLGRDVAHRKRGQQASGQQRGAENSEPLHCDLQIRMWKAAADADEQARVPARPLTLKRGDVSRNSEHEFDRDLSLTRRRVDVRLDLIDLAKGCRQRVRNRWGIVRAIRDIEQLRDQFDAMILEQNGFG